MFIGTLALLITGLASCSNSNTTALQAKIDSLQAELDKYKADEALQENDGRIFVLGQPGFYETDWTGKITRLARGCL